MPDANPGVVTQPDTQGRRWGTLPLVAPSVGMPLLWMIVPLAMTLWFSFQRYNLLDPTVGGFAGLDNYNFLVTQPRSVGGPSGFLNATIKKA